ncbi:MAG TPA: T9SS type A sorting domain-containing protein, partial [Flavobacteriales bacterium]|nr:T9SS type A sorting domain-containing protein [Flavobacteriales bacterium]
RSLLFPTTIPTGWTHVATVANSDCLSIYYDGVLVAYDSTASGASIVNSSVTSVVLGQDPRYNLDPGRNSDVAFDNFAIWDVARTQTEVMNDMTTCLAGNEPNLVHYTQFNDKAGLTINSLTGPGGSFINATTNWVTGAGVCDLVCDMELSTTVSVTVNTVDVSTNTSSVTITANATPATYQWVDCNNAFAPISGETNQSFTAGANGDYAVIITESGCTDTSACQLINGVGLYEIEQNGFSIFPNPTTGFLAVITNASFYTVKLFDAAGKLVLTRSNASGQTMLDINHLENGVYSVQLVNQGSVYTDKVVKQD